MSNRDPRICGFCGREMLYHRYFEFADRGRIICPGTWLILGADGELHLGSERELRR
jgi:hypothetical protein